MQWTGTWHTKTWSRRSFATLRVTNTSCIDVNPVLALQPWKNFLIRISTNVKMMKNVITVSGRLRIEQYWQPLQSLTENTKRLWFMTIPYRKAKNDQFFIQDEIRSYRWNKQYCKLHPLVVYYLGPDVSLQHDSLFFSFDDKNHYTS